MSDAYDGGGLIVSRRIAPDEEFVLNDDQIGPTMTVQIGNGILKITATGAPVTPTPALLGVTDDQRAALDGANSPNVANVFATMADVHGWDNSVLANVIWVSKGGNDTTGDGTITKPYVTISKAITEDAGAGNGILTLPGTYDESLDIVDKVHVAGLFEDSVFIINTAAGRGVIQVGAVTGGAKGVIFERLTVANSSDTAGACALEVTNAYNNIGGVKFMDGILSNAGTANGKALITDIGTSNTLYLDVAGTSPSWDGTAFLTKL